MSNVPPHLPMKTPPNYHQTSFTIKSVVYYESIKRELKTKPIKECRCDERLQTRVEESTRLTCPVIVTWSPPLYRIRLACTLFNFESVVRGTGTPKDRDEVNKHDTCEWDGWICERDVIGAPSIFKLTHRASTLVRVLPTFVLSCERKVTRLKVKSPPLVCCAGWTPEAAKKRSVSRWACKNSNLMNSLCNLPEVLPMTGMNATDTGGLLL